MVSVEEAIVLPAASDAGSTMTRWIFPSGTHAEQQYRERTVTRCGAMNTFLLVFKREPCMERIMGYSEHN